MTRGRRCVCSITEEEFVDDWLERVFAPTERRKKNMEETKVRVGAGRLDAGVKMLTRGRQS